MTLRQSVTVVYWEANLALLRSVEQVIVRKNTAGWCFVLYRETSDRCETPGHDRVGTRRRASTVSSNWRPRASHRLDQKRRTDSSREVHTTLLLCYR